MTPTLTPAASVAPRAVAPPADGDRCDRCGAQAKVRVVLASGGELVFCGHHARAYDATIRAAGAEVAAAADVSVN